jgi:hypothetical protein
VELGGADSWRGFIILLHSRYRGGLAQCQITPKEEWHQPLLRWLQSHAPLALVDGRCHEPRPGVSALHDAEMPSRPLILSLCWSVVALPLITSPSCCLVTTADHCISSQHSLVAPPSCRLVAPGCLSHHLSSSSCCAPFLASHCAG